MKIPNTLLAVLALLASAGCTPKASDAPASDAAATTATPAGGQASVSDKESMPDVVKVAVGSKDHTTLVAALKAADLVNSLANAGPFTVFAPTNAAFDKLPKGTVDDLLKPANKPQLVNILQHHVTTSARDVDSFNEGDTLQLVDGTSEVVSKKGSDTFIGGAKIVASVRASNGWVHVVDAVLVPTAKKK
jgi:uncharacterized surface protein with fasciclin (FAS1) repeats